MASEKISFEEQNKRYASAISAFDTGDMEEGHVLAAQCRRIHFYKKAMTDGYLAYLPAFEPEHLKRGDVDKIFFSAASLGYAGVIDHWFPKIPRTECISSLLRTINVAAAHGQLEVLDYCDTQFKSQEDDNLQNVYYSILQHLCQFAITEGKSALLIWLGEHLPEARLEAVTPSCFIEAIKKDNVTMLQCLESFLLEKAVAELRPENVKSALLNASLDSVDYYHHTLPESDFQAYSSAALTHDFFPKIGAIFRRSVHNCAEAMCKDMSDKWRDVLVYTLAYATEENCALYSENDAVQAILYGMSSKEVLAYVNVYAQAMQEDGLHFYEIKERQQQYQHFHGEAHLSELCKYPLDALPIPREVAAKIYAEVIEVPHLAEEVLTRSSALSDGITPRGRTEWVKHLTHREDMKRAQEAICI